MCVLQDLDAETAAHIENEVLAQTKAEECEFLQDLLEKVRSWKLFIYFIKFVIKLIKLIEPLWRLIRNLPI